jgi:alanyl-tRNA synthetase
MLFGEKYGDRVRVVSVDGISMELCGGTHLNRTGQIGQFLITAETSVGAGLRRVEAVTGRGAELHVRQQLELLAAASRSLKVQSTDAVVGRIDELIARNRELERELQAQRGSAARDDALTLASQVHDVEGVPVVAARVEGMDADAMRAQVDVLRDQLGSAVVVLGTVVEGKPRLIAGATDDLVARGVHAGRLIKEVASIVGGGGGGRPNLAEAGGRDPEALDEAIAAVAAVVGTMVSAGD